MALNKSFKDKLPEHFRASCLINRRSFEQCSSEDIANYKASLYYGNSLLDLTGGLGIDDWAFSRTFKSVTSLEPNIELNLISNFNFKQLNVHNVNRISSNAEDFLGSNTNQYDLIYIDPDRRNEDKRQILLSEHQPNSIELLPKLLKISNIVLIKCSPLYDYEMSFKELIHVNRIYSISRKGEMKELLIECNAAQNTDFELICTDCDGSLINTVRFKQSNTSIKLQDSQTEDKYFYEVGASIVKVRHFNQYAALLGLNQIDNKVPYFTSSNLLDNFIGRIFTINHSAEFSSKALQKYLKQNSITQINLKVRGLNYSTEQLRQSLKVKEGGNDYVFVLPSNGKSLFYHCKKIN